jgi:hypothetical protein
VGNQHALNNFSFFCQKRNKNSGQLVEALVKVLAEEGREPMTLTETRQQLGLL